MLRALSRRSMSTEAAATAPLVMFGTAGRYANAIYAASAKKGEIDQVSADLALFKETMQTSPVLNNFCIDPSMGRDEKAKGVISLLTSAKACDTTKNSLASLAEGGRLGDVVKVIDMFESIVTAGKGDVKAVITSAEALPAAELAEITKQLTGLLVRAALRKKSSGKKTGGSSLPLDLLRRSSRHDRERNGGGACMRGASLTFSALFTLASGQQPAPMLGSLISHRRPSTRSVPGLFSFCLRRSLARRTSPLRPRSTPASSPASLSRWATSTLTTPSPLSSRSS